MGRRPAQRIPLGDVRELKGLLHPEAVFSDPFEVVASIALVCDEKRAILARWLSRVCAAEAALGLERAPAPQRGRVEFDDVMDALRALERVARGEASASRGVAARPSAYGKSHKPAGRMH